MASTRDPYLVLGVARSATAEEIKQAYRRLAKQLHPDLNPGRTDIEQRFKEVSAAYHLLSDPDKRARFDRGEIDATGAERMDRAYHRTYRSAGRSAGRDQDPFGGFSAEDIFGDIFGNVAGGGRWRGRSAGAGGGTTTGSRSPVADVTYALTIPFTEAALGGKRRVTLAGGRTIDVTIPPGTDDQQKLRLKGKGRPGIDGSVGDAIIEISVEPHPFFSRKDADIHVEVPVTLPEALLGATIRVPTLDGQVNVKVPKASNTGTTLRLKGKGIRDPRTGAAGDQYVKLKVVLPDKPDADLMTFIERWAKEHGYDVRTKAGMA